MPRGNEPESSMSDPIRILELRSVWGTGGGPEKTIVLGAARADRRRFQVTVAYIRDARDQIFDIGSSARRAGVDYAEVTERHSLDWSVLSALRRLIRDLKIDIVHAHDYKTNLLALILARTDRVIPLATAHGWTGHSIRERVVYYPIDRLLLRSFERVIAVSDDIRQQLENVGVRRERIVTLLNGIDHRAFHRVGAQRESARLAFGLMPGDFAIGAVGRLEPQKRFDILLDACARVAVRRPQIRILIAGDGSLRAQLEARAMRLFRPGQCRVLGHCSTIPMLHHALDLFVQSSDYEGSPNVVLEAMAFETPVVATMAGGTAQIVRDRVDGLLVPCDDGARLALAIDEAMDDPQATTERVRAARSRVEHELSFDTRQEALEEIYDTLTQDRSNRQDSSIALAEPRARRMDGRHCGL